MLFSCDTLYQAAGSFATAYSSAIVSDWAVQSGMSREDAHTQIGNIVEGIGLNRQNAEIGMHWQELNKYDKQSIFADYALDGIGETTGQQELMGKFKQIKDAQFNHISAQADAIGYARKTGTPVDKQKIQESLNKRNLAYANIGYDTWMEAEEKQAQHLVKKMQIRNQLLQKGYTDPEFALEVAGSIIAVQKSDLSYEEKDAILKGYGFSESSEQIVQYVNEVMSDSYLSTSTAEAEKIKAEEAKRQTEIQRQQAEQKAAEERRNAIQKIETAKINGYSFDETALSQSQKSELDVIADILNQYSDIKLLIVGNTCNIGYKNINLKKGLKRAVAGKEYLIEKGISQKRISVDSKGETQPLVQNLSEDNRKQNRIIEFIIE
jgi:outer membrane protein OmpA-like peptidoglycan-associated protein